jgi:outer membrane biosynthesis protein TonB
MYLSSGVGQDDIGAASDPVVVEVYINNQGQVYDYRIVSGPKDPTTRAQVENLLLLSRFEPARFFGRPVRGLAVLSFAGVSVRG